MLVLSSPCLLKGSFFPKETKGGEMETKTGNYQVDCGHGGGGLKAA